MVCKPSQPCMAPDDRTTFPCLTRAGIYEITTKIRLTSQVSVLSGVIPRRTVNNPNRIRRITGIGLKRSFARLSLAAALLMLYVPAASASLSVQEAQAAIVRHFGFPVAAPHATVCGELNSPVWKGFEKLLEQGYLEPNKNRSFQYEPRFVPTEKSRPYIRRGPTFNVLVRDYCMQVHVCTVVFKGITRMDVDEAHGTARVEYTTGLEAIEPFYSLFCTDPPAPGCRPYAGRKLAETTPHVANLKKTEKGWEVDPATQAAGY